MKTIYIHICICVSIDLGECAGLARAWECALGFVQSLGEDFLIKLLKMLLRTVLRTRSFFKDYFLFTQLPF